MRSSLSCIAAVAATALLFAASRAGYAQNSAVRMQNGWPVISYGATDVAMGSAGKAVEVRVGDKFMPRSSEPAVSTDGSTGVLTMRYDQSNGLLVETIAPLPEFGAGAWEESAVYTNTSAVRQDLTGAFMRVAPAMRPGGAVWQSRAFWMGEVAGGRTLHVAYRSSEDAYSIAAQNNIVEARIDSQWRLEPGQSAQIGSLVVWSTAGGAEGFRAEAQRYFRTIGIKVPLPSPNWLGTAVLYEASAGGHVESRFSDVGGCDAFVHQLDYLHDLGINAIWYNMPFAFKSAPDGQKGGWNHYAPRDYSLFDPILGGEGGFARLMRRSRDLGVHVLGEIVPHGGRSVQASALEPWWTGDRSGKPVHGWGGADMDYASPPWQGIMRGACKRMAEYGAEGVRIDLADGDGPNWTSPATNRASHSTLAGALGMLKAARQGIIDGGGLAGGRVPILVPESSDVPEYYALTPIGYGGDFTQVLENDLPADLGDAPGIVNALRDFLKDEQGKLPEGALSLRTLGNHDTTLSIGRVHTRFGTGLTRALEGVCLSVPGVPMFYQEQEIGDYDVLRKMVWARRNLPELGIGAANFDAVAFSPGVLAVTSTLDGSRAIALVNLSGNRVSGKVSLAASPQVAGGTPVMDFVSGRTARFDNGGFSWTLDPYETSLIRVGSGARPMPPAETFAGESPAKIPVSGLATWKSGGVTIALRSGESSAVHVSITKTIHGAHVSMDLPAGSPVPAILISGADRWRVSTRTGILSDRVIRRHFPFPVDTGYSWNRRIVWGRGPWGGLYDNLDACGRLWQSVVEPLHPNEPGIGFADRAGSSITIDNIATNACNVVLTDRSDEPDAADAPLELRFYSTDSDLSPSVRAFGLGAQWQMEAGDLPAQPQTDLHVAFDILCASGVGGPSWTAPRLPARSQGMHESTSGSRMTHSVEAVWEPATGVLTWDGFAPVPGRYRIQFEMRYSEASTAGTDLDDAYRVTVDGVSQPITWVKRGVFTFGNAYFGLAETPPIDLSGKPHSISIAMTRPWTSVREHYKLIKDRSAQ